MLDDLSIVSSNISFFIIALSTEHMGRGMFRTILLTFECQLSVACYKN